MPNTYDGYIQDTLYPHRFQHEMTPVWLRFVTTALGSSAPALDRPFRMCELGCGQGFSSLIKAAAYPEGQFVAVDANPAQLVHGKQLARQAGIDNLQFCEATFEQFVRKVESECLRFDFIALHGVYSWVSAANRQRIRDIIGRALSPGGLVYIGYLCHPGHSSMAAVQRLIREVARQQGGNSTQKITAALDVVRRIDAANAGVFSRDPSVRLFFQRHAEGSPDYLAHELLNESWQPLHVADVMADMAEQGCRYVGSATPIDNIDAVSLPGNVQHLYAGLEGSRARETFRDLVRDQSDRVDIFQKGDFSLSEAEHRSAILGQVIGLLPGSPPPGGLTFDTQIGPVEGSAEVFEPLLRALQDQPKSVEDLARTPELRSHLSTLNPSLQLLAWAGHAHPLTDSAVSVARGQALNRLLCERALSGVQYGWLVAPSLGSALPADTVEMAAARVLFEHPSLRGGLLRETVHALLTRQGWAPNDQTGASLASELERFERVTLPRWQQYGVVP